MFEAKLIFDINKYCMKNALLPFALFIKQNS